MAMNPHTRPPILVVTSIEAKDRAILLNASHIVAVYTAKKMIKGVLQDVTCIDLINQADSTLVKESIKHIATKMHMDIEAELSPCD